MKLAGIALLLSLCLTPLVAEAQSAGKVYGIGYLSLGSPSNGVSRPFRDTLRQVTALDPRQIRVPRIRRRDVVYLTKQDVDQFVRAIIGPGERWDEIPLARLRFRVLVEVLLGTGARQHEERGHGWPAPGYSLGVDGLQVSARGRRRARGNAGPRKGTRKHALDLDIRSPVLRPVIPRHGKEQP